MIYNIKCPDFVRSASYSKKFSKKYAPDGNLCVTKKGIEVVVDTNRFIFYHEGNRPNSIPLEDFVKHYFLNSSRKNPAS